MKLARSHGILSKERGWHFVATNYSNMELTNELSVPHHALQANVFISNRI